MAGFRKAKGEQAALKLGMYGKPGAGKTFTALLVAEGLARLTGKRVAFVDTEHGTDFYAQAVPERKVHPEAFDFDAIYTRSLTEIVSEVRRLKESEHGVVVIDSMTHLWEAAINAYGGGKTSIGSIPMHAWGKIKAPYKALMNHLLGSQLHVILCGREGVEYGETEDGELKALGFKMKCEGETPYEPHILLRMEQVKAGKAKVATITAHVEKDRTGVLMGQVFTNPTFESLAKPLLGLLGGKQAHVPDGEETGRIDAEALADAERQRKEDSRAALERFDARLKLASGLAEIDAIGNEITADLKKAMMPEDVQTLRDAFLAARQKAPPAPASAPVGKRATNSAVIKIESLFRTLGWDMITQGSFLLDWHVDSPKALTAEQAAEVIAALAGQTPKVA